MRLKAMMQRNPRIEQTWLEMLKVAADSKEPLVEILERGYYAVVLHPTSTTKGASATEDDFERLEPHIPNLGGTRAVNLNSAPRFGLPHTGDIASWAGPLAAGVLNGGLHALAVVEVEVFKRRLAERLAACGFQVEENEQGLRVEQGQFTEQINLPTSIVRMVLSRSRMSCAARTISTEVQIQCALTTDFFRFFQRRFRAYHPSVLGHYFIASPGKSCVAMGWDYWEIRGKGRREARRVFQDAADELEDLLKALPREEKSIKFRDLCGLIQTEVKHDRRQAEVDNPGR
ncbi:MAG TPA: hypothetical protein VFD30_11970 [Terriglobia bacterium]|jgi:hypothetical protein|nr:hypothetical protein [Terriglobia bacterium]